MEIVKRPEGIEIDAAELVRLSALNNELYARSFFPKTYRQPSPAFDKEIWDALENPSARFVNILAFRGAAKTTRARTFTSKRIAYGLSRTILYIGSSEDAALRSIRWLKRAVERNKEWAGTFGLRRGDKWADNEIEIIHEKLDHPIWILGVGITSTNIRGINFDDYRPDLIVLDDTIQDENSFTQDQRTKLEDLVLTAIKNSLISAVEEPNAKMVMLNTPQHRNDFTQRAKQDPQFLTIEIPCWTRETWDKPVLEQESAWPALYPTETLRADKLAALQRNKLSSFTKEMEVRLTSDEDRAFRPEWLRISNIKPEAPFCVYGIDPVPPPSDRAIAKGLVGNDYEAHYIWGRENGKYYLMEGRRNRGHDPGWTLATFFALAHTYRIARVVVEAVAYQKVLAWLLQEEMKRRRQYYPIIPYVDKRSKSTRIIGTLSGIASAGLLHIGPEDTVFARQFLDYSETYSDHDDDLDASAMALSDLINPALERGGGSYDDDDVEDFPMPMRCP